MSEVELVDPGEIPVHWRNIPIQILQLGLTFGLVIPGYTCRNYIEHAVETGGYETVEVWGVQGSCKSNRCLQMGYWVHQDWDKVLKRVCFLADAKELPDYIDRGFIQQLKAVPSGMRLPFLDWDDCTVDMPSSSWRTNIAKYEAIDSAWAAIRTKVTVICINNPLIDRLAKNIKDNITMEVFIGRNQVEQVERFLRLPGLHNVQSNFFKLQVEPLHKFEMYDVPIDVFREYNDIRLALADYALHKMGKAFEGELDPDKWISINQVVKNLTLSPHTVMDMASRGGVRSKKIEGLLYICKDDYDETLTQYNILKQNKKTKKENA